MSDGLRLYKVTTEVTAFVLARSIQDARLCDSEAIRDEIRWRDDWDDCHVSEVVAESDLDDAGDSEPHGPYDDSDDTREMTCAEWLEDVAERDRLAAARRPLPGQGELFDPKEGGQS